jgi:TonB family protein
MYFDFEDYHPDISPVGRSISWREGVLLSIIFHLSMAIVILIWPRMFTVHAARAQALAMARPDQSTQFVFVEPRADLKALKPPDLGEASDQDRIAKAPEHAEKPTNPLPFSRGNSPERVEEKNRETARGRGQQPDPQAGQDQKNQTDPTQSRVPDSQSALVLPGARPTEPTTNGPSRSAIPGGLLGDALRNLQRSMQSEQFSNLQGGGGTFGPGIQFDTKGVEFGPWIRRFVEQLKRNWEPLIPNAAEYMKAHVVITFNIHKDGTITDVTVVAPCPVDGLNNAAFGALKATNPTYPLPPEYPSDQAFFTVTFYYNEQPPQQ